MNDDILDDDEPAASSSSRRQSASFAKGRDSPSPSRLSDIGATLRKNLTKLKDGVKDSIRDLGGSADSGLEISAPETEQRGHAGHHTCPVCNSTFDEKRDLLSHLERKCAPAGEAAAGTPGVRRLGDPSPARPSGSGGTPAGTPTMRRHQSQDVPVAASPAVRRQSQATPGTPGTRRHADGDGDGVATPKVSRPSNDAARVSSAGPKAGPLSAVKQREPVAPATPGTLRSAIDRMSRAEPPSNLPDGAKLYACALFDFKGEEEGELTFKAGDWVAVFKFDPDGWGKGMVNGVSGDFPSNRTDVVRRAQLQKREQQTGPPVPSRSNRRPQQEDDSTDSGDDTVPSAASLPIVMAFVDEQHAEKQPRTSKAATPPPPQQRHSAEPRPTGQDAIQNLKFFQALAEDTQQHQRPVAQQSAPPMIFVSSGDAPRAQHHNVASHGESVAVGSPSPARAKGGSRHVSGRASVDTGGSGGGAVATRITADAYPESRRQPGEAGGDGDDGGDDGVADMAQLEFVRAFAEQSAPPRNGGGGVRPVSPPPVAAAGAPPSVQGLKFFQQLNQDIAATSGGADGDGGGGGVAGPVAHLAFFKALNEDTTASSAHATPGHAVSAPAVTPVRAAADGTPVVTRIKDTQRPLPEGPTRK